MNQIYVTLAPAFMLIVLGYITTKVGYFKTQWTDGITAFVQYIAVPALLFNVISTFSFSSLFHPQSLVAFYLGAAINFVIVIFIFCIFFRRTRLEASLLTFGGTFSNTVLLGIPLAISLFGYEGSLPVYMIIAFHTPIMSLMLAFLVGIYKEKKAGHSRVITIVKELFTNPIILAVLAGALCNFTDISVHQHIRGFLDKLASVASTTALFAIGSGLVRFSIKQSITDALVLSTIKLLVFPSLVAFLSLVVFAIPPDLAKINIYMASLPTGITAHLMAHYYNGEQEVNSGTILITTFISIFTIGIIMNLFDYFYS